MEKSRGVKMRELPLTFLKTGESARIIKINTNDAIKMRKLTAFGIMPGSDIILIQKYPALVLQIGFTQVALDEDIASEILISQ